MTPVLFDTDDFLAACEPAAKPSDASGLIVSEPPFRARDLEHAFRLDELLRRDMRRAIEPLITAFVMANGSMILFGNGGRPLLQGLTMPFVITDELVEREPMPYPDWEKAQKKLDGPRAKNRGGYGARYRTYVRQFKTANSAF